MTLLQLFFGSLAGLIAFVAFFGAKSTFIMALNLYRKLQLTFLTLRNTTPAAESDKRVVSGQVWSDYCDALKAAGLSLISFNAPTDPFNQAEGYRYLTRLLRGSLTAFLECSDVETPAFVSVANGLSEGPVKLGSDNPDNLYQHAVIDSNFGYVVTVTRGKVNYLGFGTQSGSYGSVGGLKTVDYKEADDFDLSPQRPEETVEIFVATEPNENFKYFLKLNEEVSDALVIVRQTFNNRQSETPAKVSIKLYSSSNLNTDSVSSIEKYKKLTCSDLENALLKSSLFVAGSSVMFSNWASGFKKHENKLPLFSVEKSNNVGGDPNIRYFHSYWKLKVDNNNLDKNDLERNESQCLVIKVKGEDIEKMGKMMTWNFQVNNYWMESLDYRFYHIHVNASSATYSRDGSICIVLSHINPTLHPQLANSSNTSKKLSYDWLETTGHEEGTMCFRWIKPEFFENVVEPECEVVKFCDLPEVL